MDCIRHERVSRDIRNGKNESEENQLHTVGKTNPNIKVLIQNTVTKKECPKGQEGEILIKSDNQMVGYYKVPVEEQAIDDNGWIHTGDIGFLREDGYLCLTGRVKEMIIRGGENIAPNEVANALAMHKAVADAKVVGVTSKFWGEEVCAIIVLKPNKTVTKSRNGGRQSN